MLIKIGTSFIDPDEIAAIIPDRDETLKPYEKATQVSVTLRCGTSFWIDATMDETEAALIDAGVIEDPTLEPEPPVFELDEAEIDTLYDLDEEGYNYLARDKDGKLFAFRNQPEYDGAYWTDPKLVGAGGAKRIYDNFCFIGVDDDTPTEIRELFQALHDPLNSDEL